MSTLSLRRPKDQRANVVRTPPKPSTRIYAILARKSPMAIIFRRGPSKKVLTISWNTETHEFQMGQWFNGRIYERRCDLSPSGERLIYFAATQRPPFFTWTAVSRPPFLKALAYGPKETLGAEADCSGMSAQSLSTTVRVTWSWLTASASRRV